MKRYIKIACLFAAFIGALASCQEPLLDESMASVSKPGYVTVSFKLNVPDMGVIQTKSVDPDGEDITTLDLFCFNAQGLYISRERVELVPSGSLSGSYSAEIPDVTDRIHFIANMHKPIDEIDYIGLTEDQVIATMEGSSGMMTYWARVKKDGAKTMKQTLADESPVMLLRDHARITVVDEELLYTDLAFIVLNTNAFGTVAPFRDGEWIAPSNEDKFVTLPESERKDVKVSGLDEVVSIASREYQYVFETENRSDDPINIIIRGTRNGETKYFRVMLIDEDSEFVPVMRNFTYKIYIKGELDYGQDTFEAALTSPATNNVWLSVSDDVKEVRSAEFALAVRQTSIVLGKDDIVFNTPHRKFNIYYTLENLTPADLTSADEPKITWIEGNTVAQQAFVKSFTIDGSRAEGVIEITLNPLQDDEIIRKGTLLIKKGMLERKVSIITVSKQKFEPTWITTNIYGGDAGSKVTLMFTIPDSCPKELFPMDVLISVNELDVRNESGMKLPVITADDSRYGEDNGIGYKYVLSIAEPGMQRLYLESILTMETGETVEVTIEAEHFETLSKTATFKTDTDARILIHNLRKYVGRTPADEYIYYYLVPQKINAKVQFSTNLGRVVAAPVTDQTRGVTLVEPDGEQVHFEFIAPNVDFDPDGGYNVDEFLLYSQNLEHDHSKASGEYYFDFYKDLDPSNWSPTAGRVLGFFRNAVSGTPGEGATYHLQTTKPKADEVIRIASNVFGAPSVVTGTKGEKASMDYFPPDNKCTGTGTYKSCVFELSTFHPFLFSAQVEVGGVKIGTAEYGNVESSVEEVELTYEPGQTVNVEFDVTSFRSSIYNESIDEQISVDPFGTAFDIYIDAPTLELDTDAVESMGLSGKIINDPNVPGRVIYRVDPDREVERTYFPSMNALAVDLSMMDLFRNPIEGVNQSGERKLIPFKTSQIVTAGNVNISSDKTKVIYFDKLFKLNNLPITGTMSYGSSSAPVPAGTFVPFSTDDGTRIGVVSVESDGNYTLSLRAEYSFDWETTPVKFEAEIAGTEYVLRLPSLQTLFESTSVNLL